MNFIDIFIEAASGSINSVFNIALIVIPLMIVMQVAKDYKVLDYISGFLKPITNFFNMSQESAFPLLIGLTFGLSYGAGVIIQSSKEGNLSKKDLVLLIVFLASCNAIFEDTLIFVAVGANGWILFAARLFAAILVTYLISRRADKILDLNELQIKKEAIKQKQSN